MELEEEVVRIADRELRLLVPPDAEALLDEEAFEHEEFLPYWAELWPSGVALAASVAERDVTGKHVLELGCGLGLPALAAALRGASVLATDWSPDAIELLRVNAERNGARARRRRVVLARPAPRARRARRGTSSSPPTSSTSAGTATCSSTSSHG